MIKNVILAIQIFVSILLAIMILLHSSPDEGGSKLTLAQPKFTRRGIEKVNFFITIGLIAIFLVASFLQLII